MSNRPNRKPPSSVRVARAAQAAQGADRGRRTVWIYGGVALAIVLALLVTVVATSRSDSNAAAEGGKVVPQGDVVYGDVTVAGSALPTAPTSGADPAVGQRVPSIAGEQFDGTALTIPASGKPKVVMFLAHWCPHCQAEVPVLTEELAESGLPTDVDLYAVTTSTSESRPNFPPADWLHDAGWPVRTIADDATNRAAEAYGVSGFPTFVAVDGSGQVVARTSGELSVEQFHQLLDAARGGSSTDATAPSGTVAPASPVS